MSALIHVSLSKFTTYWDTLGAVEECGVCGVFNFRRFRALLFWPGKLGKGRFWLAIAGMSFWFRRQPSSTCEIPGIMCMIGSPVTWQKHPLGKDKNNDVSVRRWSIASTPILMAS